MYLVYMTRFWYQEHYRSDRTSVRRCPPCLTDPMPAISKRDLPLVKAELIIDSSSEDVFKKGRKHCVVAMGKKICERKYCADTGLVKKEGNMVMHESELVFLCRP